MDMKAWTAALAGCMLAVWARGAAGQTAGTTGTATTPTSPRAGVYSAEQAARGRDIYAGMCQACHTVASHTGPTFRGAWGGRPLSDLFGFIRERMPKNEPGSLAAEEYADVLAYLLKLNGMPAGEHELPADTTLLKKIPLDTARAKP